MDKDEFEYWVLEIEQTIANFHEDYEDCPYEDKQAEMSAYQELIRLARKGYKNETSND